MTRRSTDIHVYMPARTEYVTQSVNIQERRAPTDESVRLLKEFEERAREKIESSINVGGNGFECTIITERDVLSMDVIAAALFKLNGISLKATVRIKDFDLKKRGPGDLAIALRDEVAKVIATELLSRGWPKEIGRW
jgi:hypothetical protein